MKSLRTLFAALAAVGIMAAAAYAGDPTGNWKWTQQGRNGPQEVTAKLQLKDGALSGSVSGRNGDTPISNASFKDDAVAFSIVREFNGNKFEIKYQGKLDADAIKGSIERPNPNGGDSVKSDWNAARVK